MQDTNKNAIWIFGVIIVVLGLIWATSSKPKTAKTTADTASTTEEMSDVAGETALDMDSDVTSMGTQSATTGATVKSPSLPHAGIGPKE